MTAAPPGHDDRPTALVDSYGRSIDYIRISVTDRCNLRCRYCMPAEGVKLLRHENVLRFEEIVAFMRVAVPAGIRNARITGGEPLARLGVATLIRDLLELPGLADLSLTTNATALARHAAGLWEAGLRRVNIGLSSLDPAVYATVTRGGVLADALAGLEVAVATGFSPIKVNVVLLRGINDDPAPFLELTRRGPIEVRFIEYMPVGAVASETYFVSAAELRSRIDRLGPFEEAGRNWGSGPAQRCQRMPDTPGRFAVIAPITEHFCEQCNRLRLTADGRLRMCLLRRAEIDLKPALRPTPDEGGLRALLDRAVATKPACGAHVEGDLGRRMSQIGG